MNSNEGVGRIRGLLVCATVVCAAVSTVAACSSGGGRSAKNGAKGLTTVSVALEYTPGADNIALWLAKDQGYFKKQGIDVNILPYSVQTTADTFVATGKADFGISASSGDVLLDCAQGLPVRAVYAIVEHDPAVVGVLAKSGITSPAQLDGTKYGSFGTPEEPVLMKLLIRSAGGKGNFTSVLLGTASYQAVESGSVTSALFYTYSDVIDAELHGVNLRTFSFQHYGAPDRYGPVMLAKSSLIATNPKLVQGFVTALRQGYAYQQSHPAVAAADIVSVTGKATSAQFASRSVAAFLPYLTAPNGAPMGSMTLQRWEQQGEWLATNGLLKNGTGQTVKQLDWNSCFTDKFASASSTS